MSNAAKLGRSVTLAMSSRPGWINRPNLIHLASLATSSPLRRLNEAAGAADARSTSSSDETTKDPGTQLFRIRAEGE
jgi:hypothetical protein